MHVLRYAWWAGLLAVVLASCQASQPLPTAVPAPAAQTADARDSAALAYELAAKRWCTNDDACSLVLCLLDGQDAHGGFDQRLAGLQARGLAPAGWRLQADQPVTNGTLAYMLCRALNIKGGIMMHLLPGPRYAYREAEYHGLMPKGSAWEPLTGPEVVGIMGRAALLKEGQTRLVSVY